MTDTPIARAIESIVGEFDEIKGSPASKQDDAFGALVAMDHEALARLAYRAITALESIDDGNLPYAISMIEQHLEQPADVRCMWIVAQGSGDGSFDKMPKAISSPVPAMDGKPAYDVLGVFDLWSKAASFRDRLLDRNAFLRVYPVLVIAGAEPRTTLPLKEK